MVLLQTVETLLLTPTAGVSLEQAFISDFPNKYNLNTSSMFTFCLDKVSNAHTALIY